MSPRSMNVFTSLDRLFAVILGLLLHIASASKQIPVADSVLSMDIGPAGVWIIRDQNRVFARKTVWPVPKDTDEPWVEVTGERMVQVGVGKGIVWALNSKRVLFYREGISDENHVGTGWRRVGTRFRQISVDEDSNLVMLRKNYPFDRIFKCPKTKPTGLNSRDCQSLPQTKPEPLTYVTIGGTAPWRDDPVEVWGVNDRGQIYRLDERSKPYWEELPPAGDPNVVAAFGGVYVWSAEEPLKFIRSDDGKFEILRPGRGLQRVAAYKDVVYSLANHELLAQRRNMPARP